METLSIAKQRKIYLTREQERELLLRYQAGDTRAGEQVVSSHYLMVMKAVRKFCGGNARHPMWDDLVQEANVGLVKALHKFDVDAGVRFSTYARWWMEADMQSFFVKNWSLVGGTASTPSNKILFYAAQRAKGRMASGEETRTENEIIREMAAETGTDFGYAENLWHRFARGDVSMETPSRVSETLTLGDTLVDLAPLQDEVYEEKSLQDVRRQGLIDAMKGLNPRQKMVVRNRLLAEDPATLQELSVKFGVSRERVRQIEQKALELMRPHLEHLREAALA